MSDDHASTSSPPKKKTYPQLELPSPERMMQEDIMSNCFIKTALAGVMGGVSGVALGLFFAALENSHGGMDGPMSDTPKTTRMVLREMAWNMREKSVSYAKAFALFGSIYSFNECVLEKFRAKHDMWNPALAGCATGAMLAHGGGPKAMCIGCGAIGAFNIAIERFLNH